MPLAVSFFGGFAFVFSKAFALVQSLNLLILLCFFGDKLCHQFQGVVGNQEIYLPLDFQPLAQIPGRGLDGPVLA